ncbi:MAG: hypothetical protein E7402_03650 [Ruminococcaceae bacterium]|nr:hypothetical protein [Oscillospiraceae bacterium]
MERRSKARKTTKKKSHSKAKYALLIMGLTVVVFCLSFWVTGLVLNANHKPFIPAQTATKNTPKRTMEELEQLVEEQQTKIESLEAELERYRRGNDAPLSSAPADWKAQQEEEAKLTQSSQSKTENTSSETNAADTQTETAEKVEEDASASSSNSENASATTAETTGAGENAQEAAE